MSKRPDQLYIDDIAENCKTITETISRYTLESFQNDGMALAAICRWLEIIGEAARHSSEEFKNSNPAIPWKRIIGMRNILIHAYHEIDANIVWEAATVSIPELLKQIQNIKLTGQ